MEQYKFSHEELFTLLTPAIQLLKEAEASADADQGRSCARKASKPAQELVLNNLYSRACGDWSSAFNWYDERDPLKDVYIYRHVSLATVIQLKLLGCAWKILRAVLWQQTQPKTDLYLDRFLMVAHYVYDNPDLLVKVATQYPGIWTNLVDHLEPRDVDYQWTRYAALRDIGLARQACPAAEPQKNYLDSKLTCDRYMKLGTYIDYVEAPRLPAQAPLRESKIPCMSPSEEAAYAAEHLARKLDYSQPDCVVQFVPKDLSPCPKCKDTGGYLVVIRKTPATAWSLEVGCTCGWSSKLFFTKAVEDAFTATNGAGYLAYWMKSDRDACQPTNGHGGLRESDIPGEPSKTKGLVFDPAAVTANHHPDYQDAVPGDYWSCVVPFEISDKAAKAIQDGTHPFVPPLPLKTGKTKASVRVHSGPLPEGTRGSNKATGRELMALTVPKTMAEQVQEIVNQSGLAPTMEIGSGQPGIQWAREFGRALTAAEHAELYAALQISNEAADAVWKRITGGK